MAQTKKKNRYRKKKTKTKGLEPQVGSAGRSQSVGPCAANEERAAAAAGARARAKGRNQNRNIGARRNVSDPLPSTSGLSRSGSLATSSPRPSVAQLPQLPQLLQQQNYTASCLQSPAEHETPQHTPLESYQQSPLETPLQSQTEEPPRNLSINPDLSQSHDKTRVQESDKDGGKDRGKVGENDEGKNGGQVGEKDGRQVGEGDGEKDRAINKESRSGIRSEGMVQEYRDKMKRMWNEIQQENQPPWLRKLQTRLSTSSHKRPSPSPGKSSWSSLPPLRVENTPRAVFSPHGDIQPSAQEWAWNLFHGCSWLSKQALKAEHLSMLCR
ncbi:hypothetical protein DL98DRAFT_597806 [Cadophora sp. DSE1049]|nr:hypothetical protein DL98DRAFT_597806 [Cadophora sp. DSE1049]